MRFGFLHLALQSRESRRPHHGLRVASNGALIFLGLDALEELLPSARGVDPDLALNAPGQWCNISTRNNTVCIMAKCFASIIGVILLLDANPFMNLINDNYCYYYTYCLWFHLSLGLGVADISFFVFRSSCPFRNNSVRSFVCRNQDFCLARATDAHLWIDTYQRWHAYKNQKYC